MWFLAKVAVTQREIYKIQQLPVLFIEIMDLQQSNNTSSSSKGEGICVGIRMRPLNEREIQSGQEKIFKCVPNCNAITHVNTADTGPGQTYYYDKVSLYCLISFRTITCDLQLQVFDEGSSNADIYSHIAGDIVRGTMNGINGTIFACQ